MSAPTPDLLRVANCSGFYGDRMSAPREMLEGGPIDVLTGDYLAELTMLILWKARRKDPSRGYALTFLRQMEEVMGLALDKGVKIVTNAGGLHPAGLAAELQTLAEHLGLAPHIAYVAGDDLLAQLPALQTTGIDFAHLDTGVPLAQAGATPVSANAYLGGWGITAALQAGADIVVCPRVTDASVVVGPAAWHFKWGRQDWDRLAGAVIAGHVIECGPQATGGNYAFFQEIPNLLAPGFPIAEVSADGSSVITKHPNTGGMVSVGTVTAQLLYEIGSPVYANPDVVARFDTIRLDQVGPDRVRITGAQGEAAPPSTKVCLNYESGYRNSMTFVLTGLDIEAKAALATTAFLEKTGGKDAFSELDISLVRSDKADAHSNAEASATLTITVKDPDRARAGRFFSGAVVELLLASYPGMYTTTPPGDARIFGVYWPALVPASVVPHQVILPDGESIDIPPTPHEAGHPVTPYIPDQPSPPGPPFTRLPLGTVFGARSGDKGGNANVGVWARSDLGYAWLATHLTIKEFQRLIPESASLIVERYELPNLRSLNFVVKGLLGEGVASSIRPDAQAKSLGEYLRSRHVDLPVALLADRPIPPPTHPNQAKTGGS